MAVGNGSATSGWTRAWQRSAIALAILNVWGVGVSTAYHDWFQAVAGAVLAVMVWRMSGLRLQEAGRVR